MANLIAIVVAAVLNMVIGMVWYSKFAFGTLWMKSVGMKESDMKKGDMGKTYALSTLGAFVSALILALIIQLTAVTSALEGAIMGLTLCIGFVVTSNLSGVTYERRPLRVYLIYMGYMLVSYAVMGALLAAWV